MKIAESFNSWASLDDVSSGVLDVFGDMIVEQEVVIALNNNHLAEDLLPSIRSIVAVQKSMLDDIRIFDMIPYTK